MIVNSKKYFYRFTVKGDGYHKYYSGILTIQHESVFDPFEEIQEVARKEYPDYKTIDITALNPL